VVISRANRGRRRADLAAPDLWIRLGSAQEQAALDSYKNTYHGLVVPAHILVWGRTWVTTLLSRLSKPFIVDPMTYIFSQNSELIEGEKEVKKSYGTLLQFYPRDFAKIVRRRPIRPTDFLGDGGNQTRLLRDFASRVVDLELDVERSKSPSQTSLSKYQRMLGESPPPGGLEPRSVVCPYFHFTDVDDPWYEVNKALVRETLRTKTRPKAEAVIATTSSGIKTAEWDRIRRDFRGVAGFVLWVSAESEAKRGEEELRALKIAAKALSVGGLQVHLMYGGYYSLCLGAVGATRVTSGLGYGESKVVTSKPTGGGFPARYYLDLLKLQIGVTEVRAFLSDQPSLLCDCPICAEVRQLAGIKPGGKPTTRQLEEFFNHLDDDALKGHFLHSRHRELQTIGRSSLVKLVNQLENLYESSARLKVGDYGLSSKHLETWAKALKPS